MPGFIESLTHWLVSRQTSDIQRAGDFYVPDEEATLRAQRPAPDLFELQSAIVSESAFFRSTTPTIQLSSQDFSWAGFNGRCNKESDTCYSFWAGGSLAVSLRQLESKGNRQCRIPDLEQNPSYQFQRQ